MAIKINYANKAPFQTLEEIPEENKATAENMNEIKEVVNENADELDTAKENIESLQNGQGTSSTDIANLKSRVTTLENDNTTNKANINTLKTDNETNKTNIETLQVDNTQNKTDITDLQKSQAEQDSEIQVLKNALPSETQEDENINIKGTIPTKFKEFVVKGNSKQETRSGKNLVNINSNDIVNSNIVANVDNNSLILEGDTTGNFYCAIPINLKTNTNYHISFLATIIEQNNLELNPYVRVRTDISGSWIGSSIVINKDLTTQQSLEGSFNSGDNTTAYLILYLNAINDGTQRSAKIRFDNLQVEEGTQATEYEPYGAMPSPEYQSEIENVEGSVNEFDVSQEPTALSCTKKGDIENGYWYQGNQSDAQIYASSRGWLVLPFDFEANKDYVLSFKVKMITLGNSAYVRVQTQNNFQALQIIPITNEFQKVEVPINIENADNVLIALNSNEVQITDIKIEKGTGATENSPYGYGNVNVSVCNKNIANPEEVWNNMQAYNSSYCSEVVEDGKECIRFRNGNFRPNVATPFNLINYKYKENTSYTIRGMFKKDGDAEGQTVSFAVVYTDGTREYIVSSGNAWQELRIVSNAQKTIQRIGFSFGSYAYWFLDKSSLFIAEGDTTNYVEHQEQIVNFPLAQGQKLMLGDYLAADRIHHVRKQIELDGTEDWQQYNSRLYLYIEDAINVTSSDGTPNIKSNMFIATNFNNMSNNPDNAISYNLLGNADQHKGISFYSNKYFTDVVTLKSWLSTQKQAGTPVTIEYELAEEETEAYTEEQQEAYNQLINLKAYEEETNVYSTNSTSPIFKVTAVQSTNTMLTKMKQLILEGGN